MQKAIVFGLGISGQAAAEFLLAKKFFVLAIDRSATTLRENSKVAALLEKGLALVSEEDFLEFSPFAFLVLSPGIPLIHPLVQKAIASGIEVIGEIEFALRQLHNPCIGITGTNGKTTTTLLITHVLNSAGLKARALGNVGNSLSSYLQNPLSQEILVLELSSFQLESLFFPSLKAAVILNIEPDHLDRYASFEDYRVAKLRIEKALLPGGKFFVSRSLLPFVPSAETYEEDSSLSQNEQAAFKISQLFNIAPSQFYSALKTFQRPPHRIEWVAEKNGCVYYNDSKATNVDSVMHAVRSLKGPLILLIGGKDKGASYEPWLACFREKVKMLIAFGEAAFKMESELAPFFPFVRVANLEQAFSCALKHAESGASILLSPGCSSYDQFRNYEHRGEEFKRLVREHL